MLKIKIKELRKTNNLTQQQLADILSVEKTNISKWESGAYEPSKAVLAKMADYFKVSIDYLLGQTDNPSPTEINYPNISAVTKRKIPYLGEIACGKPVFADEEKGVYFDVCSDLKIDFCLKAKGDSMINARIQDGDIVFIREQSMVNNGEIGNFTPTKTCNVRKVPIFEQFKPWADKYRGEDKTPCLGKVNKHTGVKEYREICDSLGITKNMYCLRHTFATRCEEAGISVKQTAQWLGHANIQTTLDNYVSISNDFERINVEKINQKSTQSIHKNDE